MAKKVIFLISFLALNQTVFAEELKSVTQKNDQGETETLYYSGDKVVAKETYVPGKFTKNNVRVKGKFEPSEGQIPDGVIKGYAQDGTLNSESNYKDGKLSGWQRNYDTSGLLTSENNYVDGKMVGLRTYYKSGKLEHEWAVDKNGKTLIDKYYYESGNIK